MPCLAIFFIEIYSKVIIHLTQEIYGLIMKLQIIDSDIPQLFSLWVQQQIIC